MAANILDGAHAVYLRSGHMKTKVGQYYSGAGRRWHSVPRTDRRNGPKSTAIMAVNSGRASRRKMIAVACSGGFQHGSMESDCIDLGFQQMWDRGMKESWGI